MCHGKFPEFCWYFHRGVGARKFVGNRKLTDGVVTCACVFIEKRKHIDRLKTLFANLKAECNCKTAFSEIHKTISSCSQIILNTCENTPTTGHLNEWNMSMQKLGG